MNKTTLVVATLVALGFHSFAFAQWSQSPWGNQKVTPWKIDFGVSIVDREGIQDNRPVVVSRIGGATLFSGTDVADPNTGAGPDLRIEYNPGTSPVSYEFRGRYFGFQSRDSQSGDFLLATTGPIQFQQLDVRNDSTYLSLEFNAKRKIFRGLDIVGGVRFNNFDDNINLSGSGNTPQPAPFPNANFTHNLDASTSNPHIGLQIGADWELNLGSGMTLDSSFRTGAYANFGKQDTKLDNTLLQQNTLVSIRDDDFVFAGEVGVRLNFNILDDKLAGYIGGEYHFTDDMLTSGFQIVNPANTTISGRQSLKMSGFVFGLTSRF